MTDKPQSLSERLRPKRGAEPIPVLVLVVIVSAAAILLLLAFGR